MAKLACVLIAVVSAARAEDMFSRIQTKQDAAFDRILTDLKASTAILDAPTKFNPSSSISLSLASSPTSMLTVSTTSTTPTLDDLNAGKSILNISSSSSSSSFSSSIGQRVGSASSTPVLDSISAFMASGKSVLDSLANAPNPSTSTTSLDSSSMKLSTSVLASAASLSMASVPSSTSVQDTANQAIERLETATRNVRSSLMPFGGAAKKEQAPDTILFTQRNSTVLHINNTTNVSNATESKTLESKVKVLAVASGDDVGSLLSRAFTSLESKKRTIITTTTTDTSDQERTHRSGHSESSNQAAGNKAEEDDKSDSSRMFEILGQNAINHISANKVKVSDKDRASARKQDTREEKEDKEEEREKKGDEQEEEDRMQQSSEEEEEARKLVTHAPLRRPTNKLTKAAPNKTNKSEDEEEDGDSARLMNMQQAAFASFLSVGDAFDNILAKVNGAKAAGSANSPLDDAIAKLNSVALSTPSTATQYEIELQAKKDKKKAEAQTSPSKLFQTNDLLAARTSLDSLGNVGYNQKEQEEADSRRVDKLQEKINHMFKDIQSSLGQKDAQEQANTAAKESSTSLLSGSKSSALDYTFNSPSFESINLDLQKIHDAADMGRNTWTTWHATGGKLASETNVTDALSTEKVFNSLAISIKDVGSASPTARVSQSFDQGIADQVFNELSRNVNSQLGKSWVKNDNVKEEKKEEEKKEEAQLNKDDSKAKRGAAKNEEEAQYWYLRLKNGQAATKTKAE